MINQGAIRLFILDALDRVGDQPMPEGALLGALVLAHSHENVTRTDARAQVLRMEADGFISATRDDLTEQTLYVLTPKGRSALRARK